MKNFKKLFLVPVLALGTITSCNGSNDNNCPEEKKCETCPTPSESQGGTISKDGHTLTVEQSEIKVLVDKNIGKTKQIYASVTPSSDTITYTSSDTTVATVDNKGVITGVTPNKECTITVKSSGNLLSAIKVTTYSVERYFMISRDSIIGIVDSNVEELIIPSKNPFTRQTIVNVGSFLNKDGFPKLREIELVEGITTISDFAFTGVTSLETMILPSTLRTISATGFVGSTKSLKEINLAENTNGLSVVDTGVSTIKALTYKNNSQNAVVMFYNITEKITTKLFDETLNPFTHLFKFCFAGCDLIEKAIIPNTVTSIDQYAFGGCKNLKEVSLPASIASLSDCSFAYSYNIEKFDVDEANTRITNKDTEGNIINGVCGLSMSNHNYLLATGKDFAPLQNAQYTANGFTKGITYINNIHGFTGDRLVLPATANTISGNAFWFSKFKEIYIPNSITVMSYISLNTSSGVAVHNHNNKLYPMYFDSEECIIRDCFYYSDSTALTPFFGLNPQGGELTIYYQTRSSGKHILEDLPNFQNVYQNLKDIKISFVEVADHELTPVEGDSTEGN